MTKEILKNALLEIAVEHLPQRFVKNALLQMEQKAAALLTERSLPFESVQAFGSYRKLCLRVHGLPAKASDIEKEVKGPPAKLLKDSAGKYTVQSSGFAAKNNIAPERLVVKDTPAGPFIFAEVKVRGEKTSVILAEVFRSVTASLEFPKNMVWEPSGMRFARPLRGILALYGASVIKFEIAGIKSGNTTSPMPSYGNKPIRIKDEALYETTLKNQPCPIIINPRERRAMIERALERECNRLGLKADADHALIEETVFMTEHPVAVVNDFESRFLKLPKELVTTVLKQQIKVFPVLNDKQELQPYFIAFRDGASANQKTVADGFKKVLSARLSDAVFFYESDLKKGLKYFADRLSGIQFIEGLGTMHDKTNRTKILSQWLANLSGADSLTTGAGAEYAYADLASGVVYEFPELQGYIGGQYARKEGKPKEVCTVISEFYYPVAAGGKLPSTKEAAIVSIAGKMDSLCGNFIAGQIPSGSEDPFALRRAAMGIIRMVAQYKLPVTIADLAAQSLTSYKAQGHENALKIQEFLAARLAAVLEERGVRAGVISALMSRTDKPIIDTLILAGALDKMKQDQNLEQVAQSAKRVVNILKKADVPALPGVDETLFKEEAEKSLHKKTVQIAAALQKLDGAELNEKACYDIIKLLADFRNELAVFFEKIMVQTDNAELRNNRLALLSKIKELLTDKYIDITKLQ